MTVHSDIDPGVVLYRWRTRILNGFLIVAVLLSAPALAAIFVNALSNPDVWPLAIAFSIVEPILIAVAVLRNLPIWMRVGGLLLAGYAGAIINLVSTGLDGAGPLYLLVLPTTVPTATPYPASNRWPAKAPASCTTISSR